MMRLWPAAAALLAAIVTIWVIPATPHRRMSNLDFSAAGLPQTYLMLNKDEPNRCVVLGRRASTLRRDDAREPGRSWDCDSIEAPDGAAYENDAWIVRSTRFGKGTVLFVPVYAVDDWTYPFFNAFVREAIADAPSDPPDDTAQSVALPEVEWTQLFVNRLYEGLYLRIGLPFDLRSKDGGSGILRSILTLDPQSVRVVDTRFEENTAAWENRLTFDDAPIVEADLPLVRWLAAMRPANERTLLLSNQGLQNLRLLPMPISLPELYEQWEGTPLATIESQSAALWAQTTAAYDPAPAPSFDAEASAALRESFVRYSLALERGLLAEGAYRESTERLREVLPQRQAAASMMTLQLGKH